jgi:hypothetical protein
MTVFFFRIHVVRCASSEDIKKSVKRTGDKKVQRAHYTPEEWHSMSNTIQQALTTRFERPSITVCLRNIDGNPGITVESHMILKRKDRRRNDNGRNGR